MVFSMKNVHEHKLAYTEANAVTELQLMILSHFIEMLKILTNYVFKSLFLLYITPYFIAK